MIDDTTTAALDGIASTAVADTVGLQARHYRHPALGERQVVRLVRDNLAEVEDLSLGALGFTQHANAPVGHVRNRAIGFPAWPIITDPANARHALNLVADLQRAAKLAKGKAGPAKELLESLAKSLGDSAPHFLPTFLEEGARIFLRQDNRSYAAQFFSKAREAERVHNLPIDEERHRHALLEFALAGALSAKELTLESKALLERHAPDEALELFIKLNIDRVRGGLPPYAGLPADLRRLARAAKVPVADAEIRLLASIISAPSLAKAPLAFWDGYGKALITLANRNPEVRAQLLELTPEGVRPDNWIEVLKSTGIVAELLSGSTDALPWVQRYVRKLQRIWNHDYPRELAVLIRKLPGLRGRKITLDTRVYNLEPELLDALLATGAEVTFDQSSTWQRLKLQRWLNRPDRPNLEFLASSPYAHYTHDSLANLAREHLDTLLAHSGTRAMLGEWAKSRLPADPTPGQLTDELSRLSCILTPVGVAAFPEQVAALGAHLDAEAVLAQVLNDGFLAEFTWPAFEAAASELGAGITCHESWPSIGVAVPGRVIWVQGDQRVATADFPMTNSAPTPWNFMLVDQVTQCRYRGTDHTYRIVWSNDLGTSHEGSYRNYNRLNEQSFPVAGGRLIGTHLLRVGDPTDPLSVSTDLLSDGTHFWSSSWQDIRQVDPATGKPGRESLPGALASLIEDWVRDGWKLRPNATHWTPETAETAGSPVVSGGGFHGWVTLTNSNRSIGISADGTVLEHDQAYSICARVARPGGGQWLLDREGKLRRSQDAAPLAVTADEIGQPHLLHEIPRVGWHYLRARNEAASKRLRAATREDAAQLLAAVGLAPTSHGPTPRAGGRRDEDDELTLSTELLTPQARAAAEQLLGCSDTQLVAAVVWAAARVARLIDIGQKRTNPRPVTQGRFSQWDCSCQVLEGVSDAEGTPRQAILDLAHRLAGSQDRVRGVTRSIQVAIVRPEVLLGWAASRPLAEPELIQGAAATVGAVLDAELYQPGAGIFQIPVSWHNDFADDPGTVVSWGQERAIILGRSNRYYGDAQLRYYSPSGTFPSTLNDRPAERWLESSNIDAEQLEAAFRQLLSQGGPAWDPARATRLAEGLNWSYAAAALFLAGMPGVQDYSHNYLPKAVRELLNLKVAEAAAARDFLRGLDPKLLVELVSAGAQDPAQVVVSGLDVEAMIAHWASSPHQMLLPEQLLAEAGRAFRWGGQRRIESLASQPDADSLVPWLWLAYRIHRDDPLAAWLADRFDEIRANCMEPTTEWRDYAQRLRPLLGLAPRTEEPQGKSYTVGAWTLTAGKYCDDVTWNPTAVTDWQQETQLAWSLDEEVSFVQSLRNRIAVLSGDLDAIQEDLRSGMAGAPQDPKVCAPDLLVEVMEQLQLPEESARYWLQLLSLHDPTDKNIAVWNGWSKSDRVAAAKALLERELIVEAKRSRAGRSYFLPGGWLEASTPHLPLEVWKSPMFNLQPGTRVNPRDSIVIPRLRVGELFTQAWRRYRDGDRPGYQELQTQRYRRR